MGKEYKVILLTFLIGLSNFKEISNIKNNLHLLIEKPEIKKIEKEKERGSGIIMHVTSLPSNYGIGTFGKEAYNFVDFLVNARQKYWQMLPLGPTSYGDSPYQATSSYAGNPYMIDLDILIEEKLLTKTDVLKIKWFDDKSKVNYAIQWKNRYKVLDLAFKKFKPDPEYEAFVKKNQEWLDEYSLFMAIKEKFDFKSWLEWPNDIKLHKKAAINSYKLQLDKRINFQKFIQFKFYQQLNNLKKYCSSKGIKLIGDVPIYVPIDSSDVWSSSSMFQLTEKAEPKAVAGVPPDYFSADGQLWGNPLYDWEKMAKDNYKWFINRLKATGAMFDVIRIDHFRGLESYWSVPYGDKNARGGQWIKGPGVNLIKEIHKQLPNIEFIAEDLGFLTPEVLELRDFSGFPGMKVLEFAFSTNEYSNYLPHRHIKNSVCYVGTHDNELLKKWQFDIFPAERRYAEEYLGVPEGKDLRLPMIRAGMASISYLFIAQIQDYLGLGGEARMNRPGITDGLNWVWRALPGQINNTLAESIAKLTKIYER